MKMSPLNAVMFHAASGTQTTTPLPAEAALAEPSQAAPQNAAVDASKLVICLDVASQRFVQMLIEPGSQSVLRRFPHEGQLVFSRGVSAYLDTLSRKTDV